MNKVIKICIIYAFFISNIFAQGFVYNGTLFFNESKEFVKNPSKWGVKDFITLSSVAVGTYGLSFIDEDIREIVTQNNQNYKNFYYEFGRVWGEPFTAPIVGSLFLIHGSVNNNPANERIGYEIIQSYTYTAVITGILKISFGRARPYTNNDAFTFSPFSLSGDDYYSLPSGHSSLSFALSTTLSLNSKTTFGKVISFIPALLTVTSRITYNKHWLSDTFMGAAIGYFVAKYTHELHDHPQNQGVEQFQNPPSINILVPLF